MPQDRAVVARSHSPLPFGIDARLVERRGGRWGHAVLVMLLIGGPLVAALLGWLGGCADEISTARSSEAAMSVETPRVLRSGNWFETQVVVVAVRDIADLAIAIDQPLWRGISIDTAVPDAKSVEALDGRFTYRFGPLKAGRRFLFKIDGQIQPRGLRRLSGRIAVLDGERGVAGVPLTIQVLP